MQNSFELLLPVGQKEMALAAIHNGADAIFMGFPGFNARGRSYDHEIHELKELIQLCHGYGVKVNLAFNIVIFETEWPKVTAAILDVLPLKPDALIIQDLGLARLVRQIAPNQVIHGSTQMTVTNDLAIEFLSDLNIKRFVLGRENSLDEIRAIKNATTKELEVFVHGALCVSYSGQCFTSESIGGRSANRGQCAQSCRFGYELIVDGVKKDTVQRDYLVSPQDLCGLAEIPELMNIGVHSFKVEGRLKTPDYVASVARSYRQMIDHVLDEKSISVDAINQLKTNMAVQYSRGFFPGWLHGVNHQQLVDGTFSSHRGAPIGRVARVDGQAVILEIADNFEIKNGDGLLFVLNQSDVHAKKSVTEHGSFVFSSERLGAGKYRVGLANELELNPSFAGAAVFLNHDKDLKKELLKSFNQKDLLKKVPVTYEVQVRCGEPLTMTLTDGYHRITLASTSPLVPALKQGITKETLAAELGALSGTAFKLTAIEFSWDSGDPVFIHAKEVKILRQKLTEALWTLRQNSRVDHWETDVRPPPPLDAPQPRALPADSPATRLVVMLRDKSQVDHFIAAYSSGRLRSDRLDSVVLDYEFGRDYAGSIELLRSHQIKVGLATTRVLKPFEYQNLKNLKALNPDYILVRNIGALQYYRFVNPFGGELRGDFSLNVTNYETAKYLIEKGLNSVCVSYDLNADQLNALLGRTEPAKLEITVHQAMPSFHMEHCVFAAFLSRGKSFKDCGRPCEKHKVQLRDQFGHLHWIKPDQECRNTMYNAKSQTAINYLDGWRSAGIRLVRYEALQESGEELQKKVETYLQFLEGRMSTREAAAQLQTVEAYGLSAGSLARTQEYESRKKTSPTYA